MKFLIIICVVVVVIGGLFLGLAYSGKITVPGITPKKQAKTDPIKGQPAEEKPLGSVTEVKQPEEAIKNTPPPVSQPKSEEPPSIQKDGTERVAKIWSSMDTDALVKLLETWEDGDALLVIAKMEDKKLAELLSALPAERAARLSKGLRMLNKGGL